MSPIRPTRFVIITKREFEDMKEYSCSLPTGIKIGKVWKRNNNFGLDQIRVFILGLEFVFPCPKDWWMGEYIEDQDPKMVGIRWSKILIDK